MKKHHLILEGVFMGCMLGYATAQWFHSAHRTIFGVPARVVYVLGGMTILLVTLIRVLSALWED